MDAPDADLGPEDTGRTLADRVPEQPIDDGDEILERFLDWVTETGLTPYDAQEEALLEIMSGRHLILNTPTGSGKSLIATAMHFKALCEGKRSYYTSPIKALVSEKFFDMCRQLGASNVGMMTGDATINPSAPIICCTAEVLSNLALRDGAQAAVDYVVMDEFHYYADADRGIAWQVPLIALPHVRFLLMSATLGDVSAFESEIERYTGVSVAVVRSSARPVPLDFEYRETPIHETISELGGESKTPIYVVNFTQREAAEQAQSLTSINVCTKEEKKAIQAAIGDFRFDTAFGKDVHRFARHGIGIHHAGLLPKYRTLVERLSQQGLLKLISGTDTLGVGVNVPIRTVLFSKLCKFDGTSVRVLSVRDFKQIGGRAGRKGFDTQGSVVAQAPEHVIENKKLELKALSSGKKKFNRKKPPERGYVHFDEKTFATLAESDPEPLDSQFDVSHGLLLSVMRREIDASALHGGYRTVVDLISRCYERAAVKRRLRRKAATLFGELRKAGIIEVRKHAVGTRSAAVVAEGLQRDFSLHHSLSLFLVHALEELDPSADDYAMVLLSLVECVLENPFAVLKQQLAHAKTELVGRLKAEGVEYEQRMEQLEQVDFPKPEADFIYRVFDPFRLGHPWLRNENVRPKSIARDMFERFASFNDYVAIYGLSRSEGVLLRYLSQTYKALIQSVPASFRDERVDEVIAFLQATLARVDSSLLGEWERLLDPEAEVEPEGMEQERPPPDPAANPRVFSARLRTEMHALVSALASKNFEEAALAVGRTGDDWPAERLEELVSEFEEAHGPLRFNHAARLTHLTHVSQPEERVWLVQQTLVAATDDGDVETDWALEAEVDLPRPTRDEPVPEGPLVRLVQMQR